MNLFDTENINELIKRYESMNEWLVDNILANPSFFDKVARERNVLSVRIYNYYKDNEKTTKGIRYRA